MPTPFSRTPALIRVVALLVMTHTVPGTIAGGTDGADRSRSADRLRALHGILESAFSRCDARPLGEVFSRRLKVYLAADTLDIDAGYYGAEQALLILRRVFAGRTTVRFSLDAGQTGDDGQTVARARWTYRLREAPNAEVRLSFTLMPEGDGWLVREIREIH